MTSWAYALPLLLPHRSIATLNRKGCRSFITSVIYQKEMAIPVEKLRVSETIQLAYRYSPGKSPGIVFLPGFGSTMEGGKATALADLASREGREMLRFDYRGHGVSSGRFNECCLGDWISDAGTLLDRVTSGEPMILVGSSMGGWIALHVALSRPHQVAAVVGIATAVDFLERRWQGMGAEEREEMMREGVVSKTTGVDGFTYTVTRHMIEEGRKHCLFTKFPPESLCVPLHLNPSASGSSPTASIDIRCPIRLLHGTEDDAVPVQVSLDLMERVTSSDVTLTLIKGGDHRLVQPRDLDRLADVVKKLF